MPSDEQKLKSLEALREWARVGLALYTGAMRTIAMFHPEHSQTPLNKPLDKN